MEKDKQIKEHHIIVDTNEIYDPVKRLDCSFELMPIKISTLASIPVNKEIEILRGIIEISSFQSEFNKIKYSTVIKNVI